MSFSLSVSTPNTLLFSAEDGLDWWVDKDFGPQNLKSDLIAEQDVSIAKACSSVAPSL